MKRSRNLVRRMLAATAGLVTAAGAFVGATATPAHAALRNGPGYAWITVSNGAVTSSYNSTGLPVDVFKGGSGSWGVTFEGQSDANGIPAVSAGLDTPGGQCAVEVTNLVTTVPGRLDRTFAIVCGHDGFNAPSGFTLSWTSLPGVNEGWIWTDSLQGGGQSHAYNWVGGNAYASRVFPGVYTSTFGAMGGPGGVTITATNNFRTYHCDAVAQSAAPDGSESVPVLCRDWAEKPVDTYFAEHYVRGRGLFADTALLQGYATVAGNAPASWTTVTGANAFSSKGKAVSSSHPFPGVYQVKFAGLVGTNRVVHVNTVTEGATGGPCGVEAATSGADGIATVVCRDVNKKPVDETFQVTYSAKP